MIGYFPEPYPDELIYSVIARLCNHLQMPDHRPLTDQLFGVREASTLVDLPRNIACFVKALQLDSRFSIEELILRHTLLPLYTPFLPPLQFNDLYRSILGGSSTSTHLKAGKHPHPDFLRFCPICKESDEREFGEAYWHRLHQVTGAEVCSKHLVLLEASKVPRRIRARANAFIAADSVLPSIRPRSIESADAESQLLLRLTREVEWLLSHPELRVGLDELREMYSQLAIRKGLATCNARLYVPEFLTAFRAHYSPALLKRLHCELEGGGRVPWIVRLFHAPKGSQAPVRQLLLMDFLGGTASEFFADLARKDRMRYEPFGPGPWPCVNPVCPSFRRTTISNVKVTHYKLKGCTCGLFTCPDCALVYRRIVTGEATDSGISRTVEYGPVWKNALEQMWRNPKLSIREIAGLLKVDPLTVKRNAAKLGCSLMRQTTEALAFGEVSQFSNTIDNNKKGLANDLTQYAATRSQSQ